MSAPSLPTPWRRHLPLLWALTRRDLQKRTVRSFLGTVWLVAYPLGYLIILHFVFSSVLGSRRISGSLSMPYFEFLLGGLVPWLIGQELLSRSAGVFLEHAGLVKRVRFPLPLLPLHVTFSLLAVGALWWILALCWLGGRLGGVPVTWAGLLPAYALFGLFLYGLACGLSVAAVYVRDILHGLPLVLTALLYASPVFYPVEWVPARWRWVVDLNPFAPFIESFRMMAAAAQWPDAAHWLRMACATLASLALGWLIYGTGRNGLGDAL